MNALYLVVLVGLGLCVFGLVVADLIDVLGKSKKQKDASEAKPKEGVPLSEECRKDWQAFMEKHGKELSTIYFPSFQENAEKLLKP